MCIRDRYKPFDKVLSGGLSKISTSELESVVENTGALVLDTRNNADFATGFIPQSINIGLKGDFAPWAGSLIEDVKQPLILVTYPGEEAESITRLSRVGFDNVIGLSLIHIYLPIPVIFHMNCKQEIL